MRPGVLALLVAVAAAGRADATPSARCGSRGWVAQLGTLSPGRTCASVVLTGDAASGDRSTGRAMYEVSASGRGRHAVTLQRLTGDDGSVQIQFPGGYVLLGDGQIGLYTSEAQWTASGYRPMPGALAKRRRIEPSRVELELARDEVIVRIDGIEAGRWTVDPLPQAGGFAVWVLGPRGARPRVRISDWSVTP